MEKNPADSRTSRPAFRLLVATGNAHKVREFAELLGADFAVSGLDQSGQIPKVEETGATFAANATLKAVAISQLFPGLVASDDSGLEVDALNGAPGVRSARYAGEDATDEENVAQLIAALRVTKMDRQRATARFRCVVALAEAGKVLATFDGTVSGSVLTAARGEAGFGYDPVFVPDGYDKTFAELGPAVKNQISHRARAIARLREYLSAERDGQ